MGEVNVPFNGPSQPEVARNYWAEKGKDFMDHNYSQLNGIGQLCEILGISQGYFRGVFYNQFKVSPKRYLTSVRIEHAMSMLKDSNAKVCDVAWEVGFSQRSGFDNTFRRLVGVSPSQYRRQLLSGEKDMRK